MGSPGTKVAVLLALCGGLAACGSGSSTGEEPVNIDYSALRVAPSREGTLSYATSDEQLLRAVRNGLRMSLVGAPQVAAVTGISAPSASPQGTFSATTVQVAGVDEADLVKYDGQYLYTMRPQDVPSKPRLHAQRAHDCAHGSSHGRYAGRVGVHGARRADFGAAAVPGAIHARRHGVSGSGQPELQRLDRRGSSDHGARAAAGPHAHPAARRARSRQRLAGMGARARRLVARQPQDRRHAVSREQLSAATRRHRAAGGFGGAQARERAAHPQRFGAGSAAGL